MTDERPLISLLVPAFNEARTIEAVLRRAAAVDLRTEIVVVDDGSSDGTPEIAERVAAELDPGRLRVVRHGHNQGKGAAVRTGLGAVRGEFVVIQDADLEYDPRDLPKLVGPLLEGIADVVYGSRLRGGEPQRAHLFWHYAGNRFLSLLTNILFNTTISDMEVGYKAFRTDLVRSIELTSRRLRDRARDHRQAPAARRRAPVRDPDLLLRAHLRGGQEDHVARRRHGGGAAAALPLRALSAGVAASPASSTTATRVSAGISQSQSSPAWSA